MITINNNLLNEVFQLYPFKSAQAELIRHNENMTYKITGNKNYVLRIHKPIEGFSIGFSNTLGHSNEYINDEMKILDFLHENSEVPTQKPVKNCYGQYVTVTKSGISITVLEWVDGKTLDQIEHTDSLFYQIGELTARMNQCLSDSENRYKRYSYDQSMIPFLSTSINNARNEKIITQEQKNIIMETIHEIKIRMDEMDDISTAKGIVHSDLSQTNMIYSNGDIVPIDFCLCGYSHYYMDLGSLFAHYTDKNQRSNIINGYENILREKVDYRFIEPYFAMQVILFIACQYERAIHWDWFYDSLNRWCKDICLPLQKKIAFL